MSTDAAIVTTERAPLAAGPRGIQIESMEGLYRFAQYVVKGGFAPKGMSSPEAVSVAIQLGLEVGLSPMQALQNIGVINGRPGIFGDAALALVRGSGLMESYSQEWGGANDGYGATVRAKRVGDAAEYAETFTVGDAKRAELWGKPGPWTQYPKRMLLFRARGFLLRDAFGDVLKGLRTTEELADIPSEVAFEVVPPAKTVSPAVARFRDRARAGHLPQPDAADESALRDPLMSAEAWRAVIAAAGMTTDQMTAQLRAEGLIDGDHDWSAAPLDVRQGFAAQAEGRK